MCATGDSLRNQDGGIISVFILERNLLNAMSATRRSDASGTWKETKKYISLWNNLNATNVTKHSERNKQEESMKSNAMHLDVCLKIPIAWIDIEAKHSSIMSFDLSAYLNAFKLTKQSIKSACCTKEGSIAQTVPSTIAFRVRHRRNSQKLINESQQYYLYLVGDFYNALRFGGINMVQFYVQEYASMNFLELSYERNSSCLHVATKYSRHKVLRYLLNQGVSSNLQHPNNGDTALHIAARNEDIKAIKILLSYQADTSIINDKGDNVLSIAKKHSNQRITDLLTATIHSSNIINQRIKS